MACLACNRPAIRELFEAAWRRCHKVAPPLEGYAPEAETPPEPWLVSALLDLLHSLPVDRPSRDLAPLIRKLLQDQKFVTEGGDTPFDPRYQVPINREVDLIVQALQIVRQQITDPTKTAPQLN